MNKQENKTMSSGGPAHSRMAVWCRPLFPNHSNYSTPHAHERTECFGSLPVVRRSTWREPTQRTRYDAIEGRRRHGRDDELRKTCMD
ncbi:uncharacterized protein TNCV_693501 [Trichonephila clavipes]|nr:uncharacterized protein TNCV_693501 [Trichonephila clavipes]